MLFKKLQQGFDEDLITKIIMKLISNWLICLYCFAFYVRFFFYCPKIIDMHVYFRFYQACMGQTQLVHSSTYMPHSMVVILICNSSKFA
jgi:hypothetical protein